MGKEVELKLALAEKDIKRFLRSPVLKQASSRTSEMLVNHYYDTPKQKLHRKGIALRLRRQGRIWLQTVKCAGESAGGLSSRPEWEIPYPGRFDFSGVDIPAVRQILERPKVLDSLFPLFSTDFRRITWHLEPTPETALQLSLDRGTITAAGRQESICEVELELKQGQVSQLFAIAESLAAHVHLTPALLSKAERGFRLFTGVAESPTKQTTPFLTPDLTPLEAFRRIALACLQHLHANHHGALQGRNPEYIHQMRVATRRLRAAMRLFRPLLPASFEPALLPRIRPLMKVLGAARDLDVLWMEIVEPAMAALPGEDPLQALANRLAQRRQEANAAAIQALGAPEYGRLLLSASAQLHCMTGSADEGAIALQDFALQRLEKLARKTRRLARDASLEDAASLHAVRISVKLLRYGLEFCSPLVEAPSIEKLARLLSESQQVLGTMNDLSNAGPHLDACLDDDPALHGAVQRIAEFHLPRYDEVVGRIPPLLSALKALPTFKGSK